MLLPAASPCKPLPLECFRHLAITPRLRFAITIGTSNLRPIRRHASVHVTVRTSAMEVVDEMKNDDRKKLEQTMYEPGSGSEPLRHGAFESKQITVQKQTANSGRRTWMAT